MRLRSIHCDRVQRVRSERLGLIGHPAVNSLSSDAAGASNVTYTIDFSPSSGGAIPAGGSITLVAPEGTVWPHSDSAYSLTDSTASSGSFTAVSGMNFADPSLDLYNLLDGGRSVAAITVPNAIDRGDALQLVVTGVGCRLRIGSEREDHHLPVERDYLRSQYAKLDSGLGAARTRLCEQLGQDRGRRDPMREAQQ